MKQPPHSHSTHISTPHLVNVELNVWELSECLIRRQLVKCDIDLTFVWITVVATMWTAGLLTCLGVIVLVCALSSDRSLEDKGRAEFLRARELAAQPRYGACWSRALENMQSSCSQFNEDVQSKIALSFTHCHLQRLYLLLLLQLIQTPTELANDASETRVCTKLFTVYFYIYYIKLEEVLLDSNCNLYSTSNML